MEMIVFSLFVWTQDMFLVAFFVSDSLNSVLVMDVLVEIIRTDSDFINLLVFFQIFLRSLV